MWCRYSAGVEAHVLWGLGIRSPSQVTELVERLNAAGNATLDISSIEAAQVIIQARRIFPYPDYCLTACARKHWVVLADFLLILSNMNVAPGCRSALKALSINSDRRGLQLSIAGF